jgi:hypothetical protein
MFHTTINSTVTSGHWGKISIPSASYGSENLSNGFFKDAELSNSTYAGGLYEIYIRFVATAFAGTVSSTRDLYVGAYTTTTGDLITGTWGTQVYDRYWRGWREIIYLPKDQTLGLQYYIDGSSSGKTLGTIELSVIRLSCFLRRLSN